MMPVVVTMWGGVDEVMWWVIDREARGGFRIR